MLTTRYVTGSPSWFDLGTPDMDAAAAFYTGVFGWSFSLAGLRSAGTARSRPGARPSRAAWRPTPGRAARPGTCTSGPRTSRARPRPSSGTGAASSAAHRRHGARPQRFLPGPGGRRLRGLAAAADARHGGRQRAGHSGLGRAGYPGRRAATEFYHAVFGWETSEVPFPGGTYTTVNPAAAGPDSMFGGMVPLDSDPVEAEAGAYWMPYIEVADADAALPRRRSSAARSGWRPWTWRGVGRLAKLADPFGARIAFVTSTRRPDPGRADVPAEAPEVPGPQRRRVGRGGANPGRDADRAPG